MSTAVDFNFSRGVMCSHACARGISFLSRFMAEDCVHAPARDLKCALYVHNLDCEVGALSCIFKSLWVRRVRDDVRGSEILMR